MEPVPDEPHLPPPWNHVPSLLLYYENESAITPDKYWDRFGKNFHWFFDGVESNDEIRRVAQQIVAGAQTEDEKINRILVFCRTKIKNLSFDPELDPQKLRRAIDENADPTEVLRKSEGTDHCIDKLFASFAEAVGLEVRLVFSGDRRTFFFMKSFPRASLVRYMGLAVRSDSGWHLCNPGMIFVPNGRLHWYSEGQDAMLIGRNDFVWSKLPLSSPAFNRTQRKARLTLGADGGVEGHVTMFLYGQIAEKFRSENYRRKPDELRTYVRDAFIPKQDERTLSDVVVRNNLMYDVSRSYMTGTNAASGWMAVIGGGPADITFDHNTVDNNGTSFIQLYGGYAPTGIKIAGFVLKNNLLRDNKYGLMGDNTTEGNPTLAMYTTNPYVHANAIAGASASVYPTDNDYPTLTQWLADFVSVSSADYRLLSSSLSNNAATDGKDIGVDFSALNGAMAGSSAPPPPTSSGTTTPYSGTPVSLPGTVQFENYDVGGQGNAYYDTTSGNTGGAYRGNNVDIQATSDTGGGYNIGWVKAGEWLKYTVKIATAGTYSIDVRLSQRASGGSFHIEVDGVDKTGPIAVPNTGSWDIWKTITKTSVTLSGTRR